MCNTDLIRAERNGLSIAEKLRDPFLNKKVKDNFPHDKVKGLVQNDGQASHCYGHFIKHNVIV